MSAAIRGGLHRRRTGAPADGGCEVLLWGDSHADHLMPGLAATTSRGRFSIRQLTVSGCSPLVLVAPEAVRRGRATCAGIHQAILNEASVDPRLEAIVLSTRQSALYASLVHKYDSDRNAVAAVRGRLLAFVAKVRGAVGPRVRIVLVGSTPEYDFRQAGCFARAAKLGTNPARCRTAAPGRCARRAGERRHPRERARWERRWCCRAPRSAHRPPPAVPRSAGVSCSGTITSPTTVRRSSPARSCPRLPGSGAGAGRTRFR